MSSFAKPGSKFSQKSCFSHSFSKLCSFLSKVKSKPSSKDMDNELINDLIDTVFSCVLPYIQNGSDRNSVSLVCRRWYELDCLTRKHVTVDMFFAKSPSRLLQRFPFLESLTLKGLPFRLYGENFHCITPWIEEIAVSFTRLKSLHMRHLAVHDSDMELLARTRGKDLTVLMINKCHGFSSDGLMHIAKYCNRLKTFILEGNTMRVLDQKWVHELALNNTGIESFSTKSSDCLYDDKDCTRSLALLAKNCNQSLISLKIGPLNLNYFGNVFSHASRLEDFVGARFDENGEYGGFEFPPNVRCLGINKLHVTLFPYVLPLANQLTELDLVFIDLDPDDQCFLLERCPNLEVLDSMDVCGDRGLQVIGQYCKKLRKFTYRFWPPVHSALASHVGLISLAQGCLDLEYLHIELTGISNVAMECIGTHLTNLHDFSVGIMYRADIIGNVPLDIGVRAMLIGCNKLERLYIHLRSRGLTDVGLQYIGKYGHNLRYLSLGNVGESDAGLVELSKGCPKLRKLVLTKCPFSEQALATFLFNLPSLRYVWSGCEWAMHRPSTKC
ncbi:hypothetical protein CTI12_AA275040 [Artemisia annua]|uniref:COI1 F-box domain-containing protein n=1 Tax=Artemisia annua TaxID=35608 RepID=A0A2U1NCS4_ARTAN|nr:hypothetical protein CTI12_AA275040 [Artemisia annua]